MLVNYSLLCLLLIKGGYCIQFFIQCGQHMTCQVDFSNQNPTNLLNKSCITPSSIPWNKIDYDCHITQDTFLFTYDLFYGPYSIIKLKGSPFSLPVQTTNTYNSTHIERIEEFTIDWIHNRIYFVMQSFVSSGPIIKTDEAIPLNDVITINSIASVIGQKKQETKPRFYDVEVDPYRRFLFIMTKVFFDDGEHLVVVQLDINGGSVRKLISKPRSEYSKSYLDINDQKLYVSMEETIYVYNYEGGMLREFHLSYPVFDFAAFENTLYLTNPGGNDFYNISTYRTNNIIEFDLNQTKAPLEIKKVYPLNISRECYIKVTDVGVRRRKENGKLKCDRTDCPELCVVHSTRDTCVCFHKRAKARDGFMCYDCGQSNLTSLVQEPTIVNGTVSYPSNFPWQAVIYNTTNLEQVCGGTLISSQVVLTAAHCVTLNCVSCIPPVMKPEELKLALGKTKRSWNISESYDVRRNVKKIIVKDGYMGISTNYANDIALVIMDSKVSINSYVMPACLDYNLNQLPSYDTLTSYVSGFGYTKDCVLPCSNFSNTLLYTTGTTMNLSDCLTAMVDKVKSTFHWLSQDKFCMGNGTASAVQKGDSGGGLTSVYRGLHYLTGVVSVKLMKLDKNRTMKYSFGGFTNVSMHMDWIKQNFIE